MIKLFISINDDWRKGKYLAASTDLLMVIKVVNIGIYRWQVR